MMFAYLLFLFTFLTFHSLILAQNYIECIQQGYNLTAITGSDILYTGSSSPSGSGTVYNWALRPCGYVTTPGFCTGFAGEFCQGGTTVSSLNWTGATVGNGPVWAQITDGTRFGVAQLLQDGTACGSFDREGTIEYMCNATATTPVISSIIEKTTCHYSAVVETSVVCAQAAGGFSQTPGTAIIASDSSTCGGGIYDLTNLNAADINGTASSYDWYIRLCGTVSLPHCNTTANTSVCQVSGSSNYALTTYTPATVPVIWQYLAPGVLSQVIQDGPGCASQNRLTNVTLYCNSSASTPYLSSVLEHPTCHYAISIQTNAVCGQAFTQQNSTGGGGLGGGDANLQSALGAGASLPVFNANFSSNPTTISGVGSTINYQWAATDTNDSTADQQVHQGVVILNGASTSYINISTATGPNSCGLVAPIIGGPSSSTTNPGWSFEFVWKPTGESTTWAKLLDMGDGSASGYVTPTNNDWTIGFDGNDQTEFLVETYNAVSLTPQYTHAYTQLEALTLGSWYHMVVVNVPVGSAGAANWFIYVNGQLQNWASALNNGNPVTTVPQQGAIYPQAVPRPQSFIGKSDWNDPTMAAVIDAVRIYDYALTSGQVQNLAALYNLNLSSTFPPPGSVANGFSTSAAEFSIYQAAGITFDPVFNAPFATDPTSLVGGSINYQWLSTDPTDTAANQAIHKGLITLNVGHNSFVDLTQISGPQSIGQSLPILFGQSSGTSAAYGWTIDMVFKPLSVQTWSKFFDLGTGAYIDSLYLGWQSSNNLWEVSNYDTVSNALGGSSNQSGVNVLPTPKLYNWYHAAWVFQPASTDWTLTSSTASIGATWTVYINGVQIVQYGGTMPIAVFRHVSYIGRSDWFQEGNGDANVNATYDAFRVWDRALTGSQVAGLAKQYGFSSTSSSAGAALQSSSTNTPPPVTTSSSAGNPSQASSSAGNPSQASSSAAAQLSSASAGTTTPPPNQGANGANAASSGMLSIVAAVIAACMMWML